MARPFNRDVLRIAVHLMPAYRRFAMAMAAWKFPAPGTCGIYAIVNVLSGKAYVGSAIDIACRWYGHLHDLERGKGQPKLQAAWNKYGPGVFRFVVLERVARDRATLLNAEQGYIDTWGIPFGYNLRSVASSNLGILWSAETRRRMSAASRITADALKARGYRPKPQSADTKAKRRAWWKSPESASARAAISAANRARSGCTRSADDKSHGK